MNPTTISKDLPDIEIRLLLEGVFLYRGADFRDYDPGFVKERVTGCMHREGASTVSDLQKMVLHDSDCMERFFQSFSIGPGALFHRPAFFSSFRRKAVEVLRPLHAIRIWVAGCENGAETYSLAVLLRELGLHKKATVYATLMSERTIQDAERGLVPARALNGRARNYRMAGGRKDFSVYFSRKNDFILFARSLRRPITWAQYNVAGGASFNQFHCILCRDVIARLAPPMRERVDRLMYESLTIGGLLGLGDPREMIENWYARCYEPIDRRRLWFKKVS